MPLVFVHGVNVRQDDQYEKNVTSRNMLFQRLLLDPLSERDPRYQKVKIVNPYWGDLGVRFAWDQQTVPAVNSLELMGAAASAAPTPADMELMGTVRQLSSAVPGGEQQADDSTLLKGAAQRDPQRFLEAVLSRIGLSETGLGDSTQDSPELMGQRQALLIEATRDLAQSQQVRSIISQAPDDAQMLAALQEALATRFEQLLAQVSAVVRPAGPATGPAERLENLGPNGGLTLRDRLKDLFDRTLDAPARVASTAVLSAFRDQLTRGVTQFLGDVFVYLRNRGIPSGAGPTGDRIFGAIRQARDQEPADSPLIVVTHSMGGNILYDLLTFYEPALKLDLWVSVAAQVGMFEEMKIFKTSDPAVRRPTTVTLPGFSERVKKWVNVYDPNDVLSFLVQPVFGAAASDLRYSSGVGVFNAHGAYFQRASFYELLLSQLN